jgi:nucleotidyltransferase substrate binding protein (TIGR01987 family)
MVCSFIWRGWWVALFHLKALTIATILSTLLFFKRILTESLFMVIPIDGISFENLLRARGKFEQFRKQLTTEQNKAGAIYAFRYTFDLVWKIISKLVDKPGEHPFVITGSRDAIRVAAAIGLIDQPHIWFDCLDARNTTSHTYNEEEADAVVAIFDGFSAELSKFLKKAGAI